MAIKERALNKLNFLKNCVRSVAETGDKNVLTDVAAEVMDTRNFYQCALPAKFFPKHAKIHDKLLRAIQNSTKGNASVSKGALSLSEELLQRIIDKTETEKHFKKEIFFLPYQASMWDSLESVWKAAYADTEHCIAYVMPIPYCDKNPDGSVKEWHCDRDKFPKYVPTLDWQQIDLRMVHPDIIYFHNPYDNINLVTSVETRYYSFNLKQCTDKLIYIPYFILGEPCTAEGVEHFAVTPGVVNADKVIVQSEAIRNLYIDVLTKATDQPDRAYWEARISGAGSPKIDKVLTSKKEDFEMPEKWLELIQGKKVILYNTSIAATLTNIDKVCDKLRYVFDFFRNRDDVVLWWRPHPLMKSTLHSMGSQIEAEYLALEKQYIEDGFGIYDESSDLYRAICWSDAYYGDDSSVVWLYRVTCKPIMLQNFIEIQPMELRLDFEFVALEGDKLWGLSQRNFIGLYEMDLRKKILRCLAELPIKNRQPLGGEFEYVPIVKLGDKLFMAPYFSRDGLMIYDIIQSKFDYLPIDKSNLPPFAMTTAFAYGFSYNNSVFFIGNHTGLILEYSQKNEKLTYHFGWSEEIREFIDKEKMVFQRQGYTLMGHYLYMMVSDTNLLIKLDVDTMESEIHRLREDYKAVNLCYDGEYFWIVPSVGKYIIRWNEANDVFDEIELPIEIVKYAFIGAGVAGNYVILFPSMANRVFKIDRHSLTVSHYEELENYIKDIRVDKYNAMQLDNERLMTFLTDRTIQEFNVNT